MHYHRSSVMNACLGPHLPTTIGLVACISCGVGFGSSVSPIDCARSFSAGLGTAPKPCEAR